jgi:hypothetical protein
MILKFITQEGQNILMIHYVLNVSKNEMTNIFICPTSHKNISVGFHEK